MAHISRAKRREEVCNSLRKAFENLNENSNFLEEKINDVKDIKSIKDIETIKEKINESLSIIDDLEFSDFEALKDEMESWASNMEGTNLEHTSRYETVSEVANNLGDVISILESVSKPEIDTNDLTIANIKEFIESMRNAAQEIEEQVNEAESIEFPGMYG